MNSNIYLDNNASTKCDKKVLDAMLPYFDKFYANAGSIYSLGRSVKEDIFNARKNVATLLNADEDEIIFTSCASESNTTAIMSAVNTNLQKKHIITTQVEHASIIETVKHLEKLGYKVTYLSVDEFGRINLEELKNSITDNTCLISVMMANNEIGNFYPIKEIGKIAKENNILFHCDAVQAIGKVKIDVNDMNIDMLSISGHKIHTPKGIGALYVNKDISFTPLIFGHQEKDRRGGSENVPLIVALGKAVELLLKDGYKSNKKIKKLRDYMEAKIIKNITDVKIYGDLENRVSTTSSIAFKDVNAKQLQLMLASHNIYVSLGAACNSQIEDTSYVLKACCADTQNYSPIRISLSKYTTKREIDIFVKKLINIINILRNEN